jgi:hypothetical protein
MSNLGDIYKITYEVKLNNEKENVERLFVEYLKIRNRNKDGSYRYYKDGATVKFHPFIEGGVYIESDFTEGKEYIQSYFLITNPQYDEIINKETRNEKEQIIYDEILRGLREFAEKHAEDVAKQKLNEIKNKTEKIQEKYDTVIND